MRERITYMTSPMSYFTRWPIATRILSSVLEDQGFNIDFFDAGLLCGSKSINEFRSNINNKPEFTEPKTGHDVLTKNLLGGGGSFFSKFSNFYVGAGMLDEFILNSIKTETVFYSAPFAQDFRIIKILLDNGKRVMMGGTVTSIYGIDEIRNIFQKIGMKPEHEKRLCVIQGYVDKSTPLKQIYEKWEDHVITENNYKTMWDCTTDWSLKNKRIYKSMYNTNVSFLMNSECWWGKCKFCTFHYLPKVDFTEGMSRDKIIEKILILCDLYESRNIFFFDSYMVDTDKNRYIMKALKDEGYKLSIYTGIHMVNQKYINFLNQYQINPFFGLEHTNNDTLKAIDKGYGRDRLEKAFDDLIKYLDRSIRPVFSLISDLPIIANTRTEAIDTIKEHYDYLINQKIRFAKEGINFQPDLKSLRHLHKDNMVTENSLVKVAKDSEFNLDNVVGLWTLYLHMSKVSGISIDRFDKYTNKPLVRFLPNGERLESDLYFIDKKTVTELSTWK
jgi:hypothetical protein